MIMAKKGGLGVKLGTGSSFSFLNLYLYADTDFAASGFIYRYRFLGIISKSRL